MSDRRAKPPDHRALFRMLKLGFEFLRFFEFRRHFIETLGKLSHFVISTLFGHANMKITIRHPPGSVRQIRDRPRKLPNEKKCY